MRGVQMKKGDKFNSILPACNVSAKTSPHFRSC